MSAEDLEAFQAEVAWTALRATGVQGFALAGAGALIAHGVINRSTADLDLFSPMPGGPSHVLPALEDALHAAGFTVLVDRDRLDGADGDFVRLEVRRAEHSVQVDLCRDWRQHPPVGLTVGPVLHLDDAVGNKANAMISRGLPRDYRDVAHALLHYDRGQLLELAFRRDPGLRVVDVATAMHTLDNVILDRQLGPPDQADAVRGAYRHWPRDAAADIEGERAHQRAARPQPDAPAPPVLQDPAALAALKARRPPDPGNPQVAPPQAGPRRAAATAAGTATVNPPSRRCLMVTDQGSGHHDEVQPIRGTGRALRPVAVVEHLDALCGPRTGLYRLPLHLEASDRPLFDFADPADRSLAYRIVLAEAGSTADLTAWIDRDELIAIWSRLHLPKNVRAAWQHAHLELAQLGAAPHVPTP